MSKLLRLRPADLCDLEKMREKVLRSQFMVIFEVRPGFVGYEALFKDFEEWGVKKVYLEYFESKHVYDPGISQHQIQWYVQRWSLCFPKLTFDILNLPEQKNRWSLVDSFSVLKVVLKWILQTIAFVHLFAFHSKIILISIARWATVTISSWNEKIKQVWRSTSFREQRHRLLIKLHQALHPVKKVYYFLKYLLSKFVKRS